MYAALLSALIVAAAGPKDGLKDLEGIWTVDRIEQKGRKFPTDLVLRVRLEVKGDKFTFVNGQTEFTSKVTKFDASGEPRAFDLVRESDRQTVKAIYKIEGDMLTVCTAARGDRPTEFATAPESPNVLCVYKRAATAPASSPVP